MKNTIQLSALSFMTSVMLVTAEAAPIAPLDVPKMLRESDLVILGSMQEVLPNHGTTLDLVLHVDQVFKGSLSSSERETGINFGASHRKEPSIPKQGIFFLRIDGVGYAYVRPDAVFLPSPPSPYQLPAVSTAPLERISSALASTFTVPARDAADISRELVGNSLIVPLSHVTDNPDENIRLGPATTARLTEQAYYVSAEALRSIPYATRRPYLREVVEGHGPIEGRVWAVNSMIEASDFSEAHTVEPFLLQPPADLRVTSLNVMLALESSHPAADAAPFLDNLLLSTSVRIRTGALYALSGISPRFAITHLEAVLLDADDEVRERAVSLACPRVGVCGDGNWDLLARPEHIGQVVTAWREWLPTHR